MAKVVHFEIPADDPARCAAFYDEVFGWKSKKWGDQNYWLVDTGTKDDGGIDGGIAPRIGLFEKKGGIGSFVITVEVKDIEETAEKVKKAGGKWADEGGLIHGVGFMQYFNDTEGNLFGALQPDKEARDVE
jgi:predicted enzyme related to lactoylglutathione lyase